jgi:hypothetical protein
MKESRMDYTRKAIYEFADNMTRKGFIVYISDSTHFCYGVVTHPDAKNILYFQYALFGGLSFTSCCSPARSHGSGCDMGDLSGLYDDIGLMKKLNSTHPDWYRRSESDRLTLEQYLKKSTGSGYKLYEVDNNAGD